MKRELSYRLVLAVAVGTAALILAPALENLAGGLGIFSVLSRFVFHRLCHQDPERSLILAGALLPVCARCTGIYLGFTAGWSLRLFRRGPGRDRRLPAALFFAGLLPLAFDGVLNWAGVIDTPAAIRFLTGLLFGATAARGLWPELLPALEKINLAPPAPARADNGG